MKNGISVKGSLGIIVFCIRALLRLRYRIKVVGLDALTPQLLKKPGGVLFLPNHPAEIDPVIVMQLLWKQFRPRPLIIEHFYHLKGFRYLLDLVGALPLPSIDHPTNAWRAKKMRKQFEHVVQELKQGGNFLIYPSGKLQFGGLELLGGASFVHDLVKECPGIHVVLIRTTGLWGSKFSKAYTGVSPDFGKTLLDCLKILLKNGIFFLPKRNVTIEIQVAPPDFPYTANRLEFNRYLETWYNVDPKGERLNCISYAFWKKTDPLILKTAVEGFPFKPQTPLQEIPVNIERDVLRQIGKLAHRPVECIHKQMRLSNDLGLDSLDTAQLYVFLDEEYAIKDLIPGDLSLVEDVLYYAAGYKKKRAVLPKIVENFSWGTTEDRLPPELGNDRSIQEAFITVCHRMGGHIACVDRMSGLWTYRKLKLAALVLREQFQHIPGIHVGIMLPASVTTYVIILALLLAKKVPVMMNWTAGRKALDHAWALTRVQQVITSERFLDRLDHGEFGKIEELFVFMEDIKKTLSWKARWRAFILNCYSPLSLLKTLELHEMQSHDVAVVLFTSGTESLPKGVPLTHENILSNHKGALEVAKLTKDTIFYGVLPPFHSFGFSVTGLLPLLAGIRVAYAPDPTDSHGLAQDIKLWQPTLFCSAPSFFQALFQIADPQDLQSLRLIVSGAEKTASELFDYVHTHLPQAELIEGYGITECSPIVTINRPGTIRRGVGLPIPGVLLQVIDSDTLQPLDSGQEGEVCVSGPNVFKGYLGAPRDPFVTIHACRWYLSGDRGRLGPDGALTLCGRLKRFVKIGGELISLGGLEEELMKLAQEKQWVISSIPGPPLAVGVQERGGGKPQIILFTNFEISKEDVNVALKESGVGRLVKIAEVRRLDQIPLTGTGKTHYRLLEENTQ